MPGHLSEPDGLAFQSLLDMCRFLVSQLIATEPSFATIESLAKECAAKAELSSALLEKVYSHWHATPETNGPGVFEKLVLLLREAPGGGELLLSECASWANLRVNGIFYLAAESASGAAILVQASQEREQRQPQPVYEVYGIGKSLGDLLRANGHSLPSCFELTLLPFKGRIVYDGSLRGRPVPTDPGFAAELAAAVDDARSAGRILRALPTVADAPLQGRVCIVNGLASRPELNGTRTVATEYLPGRGRYACRLPARPSTAGAKYERILLKPSNLTLEVASEVAAQMAPAAAVPAPAAVEAAETTLLLDELRAMPFAGSSTGVSGSGGGSGGSSSGGGGNVDVLNYAGEPGTLWVVRRLAVTEDDNPEHCFMVVAGDEPLPAVDMRSEDDDGGGDGGGDAAARAAAIELVKRMANRGLGVPPGLFHTSTALELSAGEALAAIHAAAASRKWAGRGKPRVVAVDSLLLKERLAAALERTSIRVGYFPPPAR